MTMESGTSPHGQAAPAGGARPHLEIVRSSPPARANALRRVLYATDLACVAAAWTITLWWPDRFGGAFAGRPGARLGAQLLVTVASMLAIASQRLYRARVSGVRTVELARLARASALSGIVAFAAARMVDATMSATRAALGAGLAFVFLSIARGIYASWLKSARMRGRFCRPVVVVGTNPEAEALAQLIEAHPETGFRVAGVLGSPEEMRAWREPARLLGPLGDAPDLMRQAGANGAVIAASAVPRDGLDPLCRGLLANGFHVHLHLHSGLEGIASQRLRPLPLAYEPLFYLEPLQLSDWQRRAKRVLDVVLSTVGLVLLAPVLAAAALAIALQDRHGVLFRQIRVGRNGKPFVMLKFRTMVPDAEERLDLLMATNERAGPLFKMGDDPRRTRVGRILEATSIDELPNLVNVLRGEMSIVGPRPALPSEVAQFDDQLLARLTVPPGITGLWQVEARENPSFHAYRRLDLYYVENWSLSLDLAIIAATLTAVTLRILRRRPRPNRDLAPGIADQP